MIKLVTFDATRTLLRLKKPVGEMYSDIGKKFGVNADPELLTSCFNKSYSLLSKEHSNFGASTIGWENWWKNLVVMTFNCATSREIPLQSLNLISERLIGLFNSHEGWSLEEGTLDLLSYLRERNVKMGVISNFDPRLNKILRECGLDRYFTFVATSYEFKHMKPDKPIFLKAKELFENMTHETLDPQTIIHVGDSLEKDYIGAVNSGWKAALVSQSSNFKEYPGIDTKYLFKNLKHLKETFFKEIYDENS